MATASGARNVARLCGLCSACANLLCYRCAAAKARGRVVVEIISNCRRVNGVFVALSLRSPNGKIRMSDSSPPCVKAVSYGSKKLAASVKIFFGLPGCSCFSRQALLCVDVMCVCVYSIFFFASGRCTAGLHGKPIPPPIHLSICPSILPSIRSYSHTHGPYIPTAGENCANAWGRTQHHPHPWMDAWYKRTRARTGFASARMGPYVLTCEPHSSYVRVA